VESVLADEQAVAAEALEESFRAAARRVEAVKSPAGLASLASVTDALTVTADGYSALAQAITSANAADYDAARESILASEANLRGEVVAALGV
jgi:hypothetical protein